MKSVKCITAILFFAITTLLLAACGGGGGGDGGDGSTAVPTAPAAGVSITVDNAELVSAEVLGTVDVVEGFTSGVDFLPAVQVDVAGSDFNYPDFFVQQLQRLPALASQANNGSVSGVIIPPDTQACDANQGTITISGEVDVYFPDYIPAVGDQITIKFIDCELEGIVFNGTLSMTITELVGDFLSGPPPDTTLGVDVVLTVFSVDDGSQVFSADGDISMQLKENEIGDENIVLSGNSLTAWGAGEVETLTKYQYGLTWELDGDYSIDLEGTLASTVIDGSVSFKSMETFTGNDFLADGNPIAGILQIWTSIDASQARLTAQDDGMEVWIEVDADGDDIYEDTIMTTWTDLESL